VGESIVGRKPTKSAKSKKGGLGKWFGEEWTDVKTGKPCGRSSASKSKRPYPACRPKAVASKMYKGGYCGASNPAERPMKK
jgi:hypothetical protein